MKGTMQFSWHGSWKGGEITIDAESLDEIREIIDSISEELEPTKPMKGEGEEPGPPAIPPESTCPEAIRILLSSSWAEGPKTMKEITSAMEAEGLYFPKGTISRSLTDMTKKALLRRVKRGGLWAYVIRPTAKGGGG